MGDELLQLNYDNCYKAYQAACDQVHLLKAENERLAAKAECYEMDWLEAKHEFGKNMQRLQKENERLRRVMQNVADTPMCFVEGPYCSQCEDILAGRMSESLQEALDEEVKNEVRR